ncbi:MAG TPA: phosphatase PAP2 family protein [Hanamia sp.]|jgi:PAP2 superfamily.|nr:phosphatase PAP2 family protein [Hanamia sp.]
MNFFDSSIIEFVNGFSRNSNLFDYLIAHIIENDWVKGTPFVLALIFFWFQRSPKIKVNRGFIIIGLLSTFVSIVVARSMALLLPFRARPFLNPDLHFVKPFGMTPEGLETWSSFPSDHAVLFFSLATCIFLISRKSGMIAYLYAFFVVCFPRIYFGLHYPTDILVGAVIGVLITGILSTEKISRPIVQKVFYFSLKYAGLFYVLFTLLLFQIATIFEKTRDIMHSLADLFR